MSRFSASAKLILASLMTLVSLAPSAVASPQDDAYISGYAQAIVDSQTETGGNGVTVTARDGVLTVAGDERLNADGRKALATRLGKLPGVRQVVFTDDLPAANAAPDNQRGPTEVPPVEVAPIKSDGPAAPDAEGAVTPLIKSPGGEWFPRGRLFEPLQADPRWPHFGAAWTNYLGEDVHNVATVSFGETISFYRWDVPEGLAIGGQLDAVLQPGVFAIFDLGAPSGDLLNADYFIGGGLAWRNGPWSALGRIFHQSSHLGDEYLLANPTVTRENFSYEQANLIISHDFSSHWRAYAGGGVLFDQDPATFDRLVGQYGLEWRSPWTFRNGWLTPIAAVDVKHWEETDWSADLSLRAGLEFRDPADADGHRFQVLVEYYNGRSPNGQFYSESIRYLGLGMHFYY